ncbi:MAG: tetratricopeptide repeat protein [Gammaproteobacteria bacterium]|nr:tetratricopeptide repeat protein [Gammaproteobacteria bacterium]
MEFETEEQQVEALKKWWKENATMVIAGVALALAAVSGFRFYTDYQQQHAEDASLIYETVVAQVSANQKTDESQTRVNDLMAEYADTPYASLAALVLAKQQVNNGELVKARQQLEWVMNESRQLELQNIARLRLIRVLIATKNFDQALMLVNVDHPESFTAMYEELKGDLFVAQGKTEQARVAYDKALLLSSDRPSNWLKLKRDELGQSDMAEPSA